jgi:phenylacetate-CoA ligase
MLIIRGVNLFHTQVEAVLADIPGLSANYQLVVYHERTMDSVEVKVEISEQTTRQLPGAVFEDYNNHEILMGLHHQLSKKIKDNIGLTMKVSLMNLNQIPRSEGGKLKRIIDLRQTK